MAALTLHTRDEAVAPLLSSPRALASPCPHTTHALVGGVVVVATSEPGAAPAAGVGAAPVNGISRRLGARV